MLKIKCYASGSSGNLYLLQNETTNILLECGVDRKKIREFLKNNGLLITDLDACIVTHCHNDHTLSIDYVKDYVDTYVTHEMYQRTANTLKISPRIAFKINSIKILPIPVEHGKTENNAFVFMDKDSCVFFGTDFRLMEQNVSNFKFDKVFIECNYDDEKLAYALNINDDDFKTKHVRQLSTHMSKENCKEHLRNMDLSKCEEIYLLHSSKFLINAFETKNEFEKEFKIKTTML
jgi:phosphoribosyl 1,2-cyclic phosphodiesterase